MTVIPPINTIRWVVSKKKMLLAAIREKYISVEDACALYEISREEIQRWFALYDSYGSKALRVTYPV